ncbi:tetratricopeptide repeat protein [Aurantivibrio plasticivorans]
MIHITTRYRPSWLRKTPLSVIVPAIMLSACAGNNTQTLGSLKYEPEPEQPIAEVTQNISRKDVRSEYQELLTIIEDENLKEQIERRIAHVYMLEGEDDQVNAEVITADKSYYVEAIKSYRDILERYPNSPDNAEVLYQLAKAYDMEGDQDEALAMLLQLTSRHPNYENLAEAYFRKGDILFNRGDYQGAEKAYRAVTQYSNAKFKLNAHYMLGWSQYKQLYYRQAMNDFVYVLNQLLGPVESIDALSKPDQSLTNDTLHAVSLGLDKIAGAATIEALPQLNDQHYVWLIYDNLGQYYLDKELYEASAESYRLFVTNYSDQDRTPKLHKKMIDTYIKGSFPKQAFFEKERFVDAYGIYSDFSKKRDGIMPSINDTMQAYLDELAKNYHARGQELQQEIIDTNEKATDNSKADPKKIAKLDSEAVDALDKAAYYYQQFIDTFPSFEAIDEIVFMRADALFTARRFDQAIPDYERVAYRGTTPSADKHGANAGYAAIVSYENHINTLKSETAMTRWRGQAVNSMLQFAEKYHQDERSASVLTNAAEYIFSLEQYARALDISQSLISNNPDLDTSLKKTAFGILAHSLFKLERFDEASEGYLQQRQLVSQDGDEYTQITERLATSVYKHSETVIAADQKQAAANELLKLKTLAPDSPVRITAQYDASSLLIELQQWDKAITELTELIALYPEHELAIEFPRKLAFAYEKNKNWRQAASEYLKLAEGDPDLNLRREALFLAATMFEKDNQLSKAITQFKSYNKLYPEPFAKMMEARYRLAVNYDTLKEEQKKLYWLDKLVEGHQQAGKATSERSRWLAAWANAEYGYYQLSAYKAQAISLPLDKSLGAKNALLDKASQRYQAAADSGIFEFVTLSAYKIADMYHQFATELRQSPRPKSLSADERIIYSEIIEEQAQPFDELAKDLLLSNINRGWDGEFNQWIDQSFALMSQLHPTRFAKTERIVSYGDEIR